MERLLCILSLLFLTYATAFSQDYNPYGSTGGIFCEDVESGSHLDDNLLDSTGHVNGTLRLLWIVCGPDSEAIRPIESHPISPRGVANQRVMYPSTYWMPYWKNTMLDSTRSRSFTRYYKDQSNGHFRVIGEMIGRPDSTIFLCDRDTSVLPVPPFSGSGNDGGCTFFTNILEKVDSAINFNDYDADSDGVVDQIIFNIYGLAEQSQFQGTGGVSGLPCSYPTHDTTASGDTIFVSDGIVIWSPSPESYVNFFGWSQTSAEQETYWANHDIAVHELGHVLGFSHPGGSDNGYSHNTFGNYEPMGMYGPFREDVSRILGPTSPTNPCYRACRGWIDTILVSQPLFNYSLHDNLASGDALVIPLYLPNSTQNFIICSNTREKIWEENHPGIGATIWHINPELPSGERWRIGKKLIDMELSSGMFSWNTYEEPADPSWGCPAPCILRTGENTLIPNTITGLDSFDFIYRHTSSYPCAMYDYGNGSATGRIGSSGNYFVSGQVFDDISNPSSAGHRTDTSIAQDQPSMVSLEVLSVDTNSGLCLVNAWGRHWSGNVTASAAWHDSVVVDNHLSFDAGTVLTIQPGTTIKVAPDASIFVYGKIIAQGTENDPIIFECSDPAQWWNRLRIYGDDPNNLLEHVHISGADYGLFVGNGRVNLNHVTVENCEVGAVFINALGSVVQNCAFNNNDRYGLWLYNQGVSYVDCTTVANNGVNGIRLWRVPFLRLNFNIVSDNGLAAYEDFGAGVQMLSSGADLWCNMIRA